MTRDAMWRSFAPGAALYALLAAPPVAAGLESAMVGHMLVQLPLLAVAGALMAHAFVGHAGWAAGGANAGGVAGLLLAGFATACWMLPRALDAALSDPVVEAAKFVTVPLFVGAPIAASWPRTGAITRGLVWAHVIAMLLVLGWLYLSAPVRLCVNYRFDQQTMLGTVSLALALALAAFLAVKAFWAPQAAAPRSLQDGSWSKAA